MNKVEATIPTSICGDKFAHQTQQVDLSLAKSSCRHCHGTGIYGTVLEDKGTKRTRLICTCVTNATFKQAQDKAKE